MVHVAAIVSYEIGHEVPRAWKSGTYTTAEGYAFTVWNVKSVGGSFSYRTYEPTFIGSDQGYVTLYSVRAMRKFMRELNLDPNELP